MTNDPAADFSAASKTDLTSRPNALALDPDRYLDELSEFDLTDAQKSELLSTLWQIMRTFVELGVSTDLSANILREAGLLPREPLEEEGRQ